MSWWELDDHFLERVDLSAREMITTSRTIAWQMGVSYSYASGLIQEYLREQRTWGRNNFFIYRTGRTNNAMWHVNGRAADADALYGQLKDDLVTRCVQSIIPDLRQLRDLKPGTSRSVNATIRRIEKLFEVL